MRRIKLAILGIGSELMAQRLRFSGVIIGSNPWILGYPRVKLSHGGTIKIGNGVSLFSAPFANPLFPDFRVVLHAQIAGSLIELGDSVGISSSAIVASQHIHIGARTILGAGCLVVDNDFHSLDSSLRGTSQDVPKIKPVSIGTDCFIGARCIILKGSQIGDRSVIGAGSVVSGSIPSDSIAAGNPAKVTRSLKW